MFESNQNSFAIDLYQKSAFQLEISTNQNQFSSLLLDRKTLEINDIYQRYLFHSKDELSRIQVGGGIHLTLP